MSGSGRDQGDCLNRFRPCRTLSYAISQAGKGDSIQVAEGSYEMAVSSWSTTGVASAQGLQIAMEEIRAEFKLDAPPEPSQAFDWSFVRK